MGELPDPEPLPVDHLNQPPNGWLVVTVTAVTALKATAATMRAAREPAILASLADPLTDLHNQRAILKRLGDLLRVAPRMHYPPTVVGLDLDHFTPVDFFVSAPRYRAPRYRATQAPRWQPKKTLTRRATHASNACKAPAHKTTRQKAFVIINY